MVMTEKPSLRSRKTAQTREAIVTSAQALFKRQGFDATTLDQIAEGANFHKQTVLRYFNTKEEIALRGQNAALKVFEEELSDPDRKLSVIEIWREHVSYYMGNVTRSPELFRRHKFVFSTQRLYALSLMILVKYEALIGRALSREAGVDPEDDVYSTSLAAMLVFGYRKANELAVTRDSREDLQRLCLELIDFAVEKFPAR
jgi:AcrR family transcriptional regulator